MILDRAVIVLGGGGHAGVVIDLLRCRDAEIHGVCDPALAAGTAGPHGVAVIGGDAAVLEFAPEQIALANGLGSTGQVAARRSLFEGFRTRDYYFPALVHPAAVVAASATLAGAIVQAGAQIGRNALVNARASIDHDCRIGAHAHIAPGATLCGDVIVEQGAHIGAGATIRQGVRVGSEALVGLGVTVLADVPDGVRLHPMATPVWTSHTALAQRAQPSTNP